MPTKSLYRNLNRHGHEIGYSTVHQRFGELETDGLIERIDDRGYYQESLNGETYHDGELVLNDLEQDD
nr:hypothetical protein [Natrinema gari]